MLYQKESFNCCVDLILKGGFLGCFFILVCKEKDFIFFYLSLLFGMGCFKIR